VKDDELARLAYEKGLGTFLGVELFVARGALVPRAETEILGRTAVERLTAMLAQVPKPFVVDMCCGAGNLACALAVHFPSARVWAADLSEDCVALTRRNVQKLDLGARVRVFKGDLFAAFQGEAPAPVADMIVCNPPYISSKGLAERPDLAEEPQLAFDGGPYGVSIHQRVAKDALAFLRPGGTLAFEFGLGQDRQLRIVIDRARGYDEVELVNDSEGRPRVLVARKKNV
jgi:release factor glutamine methyltransferase